MRDHEFEKWFARLAGIPDLDVAGMWDEAAKHYTDTRYTVAAYWKIWKATATTKE